MASSKLDPSWRRFETFDAGPSEAAETREAGSAPEDAEPRVRMHIVSPYPSGGQWQERWEDMLLTCLFDGGGHSLGLRGARSWLANQWGLLPVGSSWMILLAPAAARATLALQALKVDGKPALALKVRESPPAEDLLWDVEPTGAGHYTIESKALPAHLLTAHLTSGAGAPVEATVRLQAGAPVNATRGQKWKLIAVGQTPRPPAVEPVG